MVDKQLLQMRQETNKTILFVTPYINEVVALEDRVIIMSPLLTNTWKEFTIDLPRSRLLDYSLINSVTKDCTFFLVPLQIAIIMHLKMKLLLL